jgi:hypothetical protein
VAARVFCDLQHRLADLFDVQGRTAGLDERVEVDALPFGVGGRGGRPPGR